MRNNIINAFDKKNFLYKDSKSKKKTRKSNQHKKQCLLINGSQAVNYESGTITFVNYNKQIPILSKIHSDTECFLKRTNSYEGEYTIKYQEHLLNSIGAKLVRFSFYYFERQKFY